MIRPSRIVGALALCLLACDAGSGPSGSGTGGLALLLPAASATAALDSGYVRLSGPTSQTVKAAPGATVTIDNLLPGAYTVALEGFVGPNLSYYAKVSGVTVVAGQTASASIPSFPLIKLGFTVQPSTAGIGRSMSPGVQVSMLDGSNNVIASPSATNTIQLQIGTNPSLGAFTVFPQSVAAVNGVATFGNLAVNEVGVGYTLTAASTGVTGATSTAFNVTNKALVTHNGSGTVSIIETSTRTKVGSSITVGSGPYEDVAFTPDGMFAYVPNNSSGTVSVINMATAAVVATITVGTGPRGLAFGVTPNGPRVYVTNNTSNNVSVINTTTNTVVATVPVGTYPIRVALTPDGSKAFVTNFNTNNVSVIATATNTVSNTITVGSGPQGVAITPAGTFAYVANSQAGTVSVINVATNTVSTTITVGSFPVGVAILPNGNVGYVVNQSTPSVSAITLATNTVGATLPLPAGRNCTLSPAGRFLYVPSQGTKVYVYYTPLSSLVDSIDVGPSTGVVGVGFQPLP